jgi:hypothetical protein
MTSRRYINGRMVDVEDVGSAVARQRAAARQAQASREVAAAFYTLAEDLADATLDNPDDPEVKRLLDEAMRHHVAAAADDLAAQDEARTDDTTIRRVPSAPCGCPEDAGHTDRP